MHGHNPTLRRARHSLGVRARAGFTLIELLIALVLLDVGLLALVALAGTLARDANAGRATLVATSVATARLERLASLPCTGSIAGREDLASGIREAFTDSPAPNGTRRIVDSVSVTTSRGAVRLTIATAARC